LEPVNDGATVILFSFVKEAVSKSCSSRGTVAGEMSWKGFLGRSGGNANSPFCPPN